MRMVLPVMLETIRAGPLNTLPINVEKKDVDTDNVDTFMLFVWRVLPNKLENAIVETVVVDTASVLRV
jgi:hypothetical protein